LRQHTPFAFSPRDGHVSYSDCTRSIHALCLSEACKVVVRASILGCAVFCNTQHAVLYDFGAFATSDNNVQADRIGLLSKQRARSSAPRMPIRAAHGGM